MIKNRKNAISYIVDDNLLSQNRSTEEKMDKNKSKKFNISVRDSNQRCHIGSIEIMLQNKSDFQIKEAKDKAFKWVLFLLSFALFQTIILMGSVYFLERMDVFAINVTSINRTLVYPYETGGFFFALVVISDVTVEYFRTKINDQLD